MMTAVTEPFLAEYLKRANNSTQKCETLTLVAHVPQNTQLFGYLTVLFRRERLKTVRRFITHVRSLF